MKTKISLALLVIFVLIQFIPVKLNQETGNDDFGFAYYNQLSEKHEVYSILKTSCYDCHSNNTVYPWYNKIAPVSWYLSRHIKEGKEHLNFSEWKYYDEEKKAHKLEECIEMISEDEMPLFSYTLIHGNAKLNEYQKELLISYFKGL